MVLPEPTFRPDDPRNRPRPDVRFLIGPAFITLAAWFVLGPDPLDLPLTERVEVSLQSISAEPMRSVMPDPPTTTIGGYELECMECHRLFRSLNSNPRSRIQHREITLVHGLNDRCLNCHDKDDRSRLALEGGQTVSFTDVARMCARCHGTTYRDWRAGIHGRTNGFWDPTRGPMRRLKCTECHDPHAPAFGSMQPLPGPNTLRMGDPRRADHAPPERRRTPLRHWSSERPSPRPRDDDTRAQGEVP